MPEQIAQKITDLDDFVTKYYGRRVEITCKKDTIWGAGGFVCTAKVEWLEEIEDEETGDLFSISFDDAMKTDGETLGGIVLPLSYIDSFIPLEGENSAADIKRLWGK